MMVRSEIPLLVPDPNRLRRAYGAFPTGVVTLAALIGGTPVGLAASSFTSVSLDPPLVSVSIAHTSTTWPELGTAVHLGVSVLTSKQELICRQLAARNCDRFAGIGWRSSEDGAVFIDQAAAWLTCSRYDSLQAGDHEIIVLRVHDFGVVAEAQPLVFHASTYKRLG
jgi:flavin reductase (DIM6/NTAB) family NADH-FMN oxidoreductase RutF